MVCDIYCLPNEILAHIFSYLDEFEILTVSTLCKQWLSIVNNHSHLLNNVTVLLSHCSEKVFKCMIHRFSNFKLKGTTLEQPFLQFLRDVGPQIRQLTFEDCTIADTSVLQQTPIKLDNLRSLKVLNSHVLPLFSHLPKLKVWHLLGSWEISDQTFMKFQEIIPSGLQEFSLTARVVFDPKVLKRFYLLGTSFRTEPTDVLLSFPVLQDFILKHRNTLQYLDLSQTGISEQSALSIAQIKGLQLKRIVFRNFYELESTIPAFCSHQQSLVQVLLSGSLHLKDEAVVEMCELLPRLKQLTLASCTQLDGSAVKVFQLKHLKMLDLSNCKGIQSSTFEKAVSCLGKNQLLVLSLSGTSIESGTISQLLPLLARVEELNLSGCAVTDDIVQEMSRTLTSLKWLDLSQTQILDAGLRSLYSLNRLRELQLRCCHGINFRSTPLFDRKFTPLTGLYDEFRLNNNVITVLRAFSPRLVIKTCR